MTQEQINQRFVNAHLVALRKLFPGCLAPENRHDTDEMIEAKRAVYGLLKVAEEIK